MNQIVKKIYLKNKIGILKEYMRKGFAPDDETGEELDWILTVLYLVITPIAMLVRKKTAEIFFEK